MEKLHTLSQIPHLGDIMLHLQIIANYVVMATSEQPRQKVHREHLKAPLNPWRQNTLVFQTSIKYTKNTI